MPKEAWGRLQATFLASVGDRGPFELNSGAMVVVPSLTLPGDELKDIAGVQFYEERLLFLLLQLAEPDAHIIFVSSSEIAPEIVDYYLDFLAPDRTILKRLTLVAVGDTRPLPLTTKLLQHQETITWIRTVAQEYGNAYLLPFIVTPQEEELAARIGIPIYGMSSGKAYLGGKSGGRHVAQTAGVPVIKGIEDVQTATDVETAFHQLRCADIKRAVLKLDDSFSGLGNVILSAKADDSGTQVAEGLWALLPHGVVNWDDYLHRLSDRHGVVESLLEGPLAAPSVQILVKPGHAPQVISTHDQILGGQANQIYLGCEFPANESYRETITKCGLLIADVLAKDEVVGFFSVDFLISLSQNLLYFGEINLRLGGTTHPFGICRCLTQGVYDQDSGLLMSPLGPRYYVASDNVQEDNLIGKSAVDLLKAMGETGLLFDKNQLAGVTLHQMGSLPSSGKLGVCSIAPSREQARRSFQDTVRALRQT